MTAASNEVALLPCPFCGGAAERFTSAIGKGFENRQVQCRSCGASAFDHKWQTRAHSDPRPVAEGLRVTEWREVAKLAGLHGIRYRTNTELEQFLSAVIAFTNVSTAVTTHSPAPMAGEGGWKGCESCGGTIIHYRNCPTLTAHPSTKEGADRG